MPKSEKGLQKHFREAYENAVCAKCGKKELAFLYEGIVLREIQTTKDDIVAKWRVDEIILESAFFLCRDCAKDFAKLLKNFFGVKEVDSDGD